MEEDAAEVPCLAVLTGSSRGRVIALPPGRSLIGREPSARFCLDDEGVSRNHAAIELSDDGLATIEDLSSTNGTFVNGARVRRVALREGDRITVGSAVVLRLTNRLREELAAQGSAVPTSPPADLPLSKRELEVASLAAEALSTEAIAKQLQVSVGTVKSHLRNVYQRLNLHSRSELTRYFLEHGIHRPGTLR